MMTSVIGSKQINGHISPFEQNHMIEEPQIQEMFLQGLAVVVGTKVAERTRTQILKFRRYLPAIGAGVWATVLCLLFS